MTSPAQTPQDALTHATQAMVQAGAAISTAAQVAADQHDAEREPEPAE